MGELPRDLFPEWYRAPLAVQSFFEQIIIHWLEIEVDQKAEERMPTLREMVGFRNREVYNFIKVDQKWIDEWVRKTYLAGAGPGAIV